MRRNPARFERKIRIKGSLYSIGHRHSGTGEPPPPWALAGYRVFGQLSGILALAARGAECLCRGEGPPQERPESDAVAELRAGPAERSGQCSGGADAGRAESRGRGRFGAVRFPARKTRARHRHQPDAPARGTWNAFTARNVSIRDIVRQGPSLARRASVGMAGIKSRHSECPYRPFAGSSQIGC